MAESLLNISRDQFQIIEGGSESYPFIIKIALEKASDEKVVFKTLVDEYPKKEHVASLKREFRILSKLSHPGIIGVKEIIEFGEGNAALVLEYFGVTLREFLIGGHAGKCPLELFYPLAFQATEIVSYLHQQGVIHKDVSPDNLLIEPHTGKVKCIDFSVSSELSREHTESGTDASARGSLPYMSPEQTGRINRDVDYRSDYYSLGCTLFELLAGQTPLHGADTLEWVHAHIGKEAPLITDLRPEVPRSLALILEKLLAKNAEDRYQSPGGLLYDLKESCAHFEADSCPEHWQTGATDVPMVFQISQKLYGRDEELRALENIFHAASEDKAQLCLVSGYSGVGKSVLVQELGRSIAKKKGYLIQGKFEQYLQNTPYMALAGALRSLVRSLLGEPKTRLDEWRSVFEPALQGQGQLLVDMIPDLEIIIGPQKPLPDLLPNEAQNRFSLLVIDFINAIASGEHPLVIFLDDLQWSDIPTLHLIQRIAVSQELSNIMIVGAYRDNAVDATHPLMLILSEIRKKRTIEHIALKPLNTSVISEMVSDSLHCNATRAKELSDLLFEKTDGNPFFTIEMLKELHRSGVIYYDPNKGEWNWETKTIREQNRSDNVIDFLVQGMFSLPKPTQEALQIAAALGASFDLRLLSQVSENKPSHLATALFAALNAHLIVPLNDDYRIAEWLVDASDSIMADESFNPVYRFQHDRVQQAAYSMLSEASKEQLHLKLGLAIKENHSDHDTGDSIIQAAEHFNKVHGSVDDPLLMRDIAAINFEAAKKAKASSAYASALDYLQQSNRWLAANAAAYDEDMARQVLSEMQNCYYLTGDWDAADRAMEQLLLAANTQLEKGALHARRTRQYATTGRMEASIAAAYEGLIILGFDMKSYPDEHDVDLQRQAIENRLAGRSVSELIHLPKVDSETAEIAGELLAEVFAAAFLSASGLKFPYLIMQSVNLALNHGNNANAAFAYTTYGMLLCGYYNNPSLGIQYGRLGVTLIDQTNDLSLKSRVYYVYTMFVHHWSYHWKSMTEWFRKGIENGYQTGDLLYLSYSAQDCIIWDPTLDLETASEEQTNLLKIVEECEYKDSLDSGTLFLQMQLNFLGKTEHLYSLTSAAWNEQECLKGMQERKFMTGIANYHIYKTELYVLYHEAEKAWEHVQAQDALMSSVMSLPQLARYHFISFIVRNAMWSALSEAERTSEERKMKESLSLVSIWAANCEDNFEHLRLFMEAVLACREERLAEAWVLYEKSIQQARKFGFLRDEALANEYMAASLSKAGLAKGGEGYMRAAHHLYYRWAAYRKTQLLEEKYPFLKQSDQRVKLMGGDGEFQARTASFNANELDLASVLRASQTISGELVLDTLLEATLKVILENAGAQVGHLLVYRDDKYFLFSSNVKLVREWSDAGQLEALPMSLVNTVLRTKSPIILENASASLEFQKDPYIVTHQPKSVICIPFSINSFFKIVIYLENNLTTNAFTPERFEVIKLLSAQAAISIENARIYEKQEVLVQAQQRFVPSQFLKHLGHDDIAKVNLGESVGLEMSILFSDIRDFTPLVEALTPQAVIELLNEYLSKVGVEIDAYGGFIDSYAGDEIMALYSVPPQDAVSSAVRMTRALEEFNRESALRQRPPLNMGIGINTGSVVLGTMGGLNRMQCTVLGDAVNLASRIEQLTKPYGAKLLIGEKTFQSLSSPEAFHIRFVDRVAVKGKANAVKLYEVISAETEERVECKLKTKALLESAMNEYYNRNFVVALEMFVEGMHLDPLDKVFPQFVTRCEAYIASPPAPEWQGFEVLKSKS
jgi:predicted ATPase/class 3 adenylate cyclase/tRNA A-37 threonylcarbamoyl transferase component Bud32